MGWDGNHIRYFGSIKQNLNEMFNWRDTGRRISLVDYAVLNRNVAYCAIKVEYLDGDCVTSWSIKASVVLYRFTKNQYMKKAMSEEAGPNESHCPERILNLLTPTTNEWALRWRERCRKNIANRQFKMKEGLELISRDGSRVLTLGKKLNGRRTSFWCVDSTKPYGSYTVSKQWCTQNGFYPAEIIFANAL